MSATRRDEVWKPTKRLLHWARPHMPAIIAGMVLGLGMTIAQTYVAALQKDLIDTMNGHDIPALVRMLVSGGLVIVACVLLGSIGGVIKGYTGAKVARDFRLDTFDHVNHLPLSRMDQMHSGDLVSRTSGDASKATGAVTGTIFWAFDIVTMMVAAFIFMARINLLATLVASCAGPTIFLSGRFFDKGIRVRGEEIQRTQADMRKFLQDNIQGSAVVAAYGLEDLMTERFRRVREESRILNLKQAVAWSALWQSGSVTNTFATMACALMVAYQAVQGHLSSGSVLAFVILVNRVTWPVVNLSQAWGQMHEGLGSAKRVFEVLDMAREPLQPAGTASLRAARAGADVPALELRGVSFSYETRADVLTDINIRVAKGQMVAVVGPSGSGKSTLAKLCLGLYEPTVGSVKVAGHSTTHELGAARAESAYVPQAPHMFARSLRDNIEAGREGADDADVMEAVRAAGLDEVAEGLVEGLSTAIGEKGVPLSGGQRQRVSLARALMRRASLVVLDEATSALDNETESFVQGSIAKLREHAGLLVIAHRLTTVLSADLILVMEDGRITEQGTHDELLRADGTYARLWALTQAGGRSAGSSPLAEVMTA